MKQAQCVPALPRTYEDCCGSVDKKRGSCYLYEVSLLRRELRIRALPSLLQGAQRLERNPGQKWLTNVPPCTRRAMARGDGFTRGMFYPHFVSSSTSGSWSVALRYPLLVCSYLIHCIVCLGFITSVVFAPSFAPHLSVHLFTHAAFPPVCTNRTLVLAWEEFLDETSYTEHWGRNGCSCC